MPHGPFEYESNAKVAHVSDYSHEHVRPQVFHHLKRNTTCKKGKNTMKGYYKEPRSECFKQFPVPLLYDVPFIQSIERQCAFHSRYFSQSRWPLCCRLASGQRSSKNLIKSRDNNYGLLAQGVWWNCLQNRSVLDNVTGSINTSNRRPDWEKATRQRKWKHKIDNKRARAAEGELYSEADCIPSSIFPSLYPLFSLRPPNDGGQLIKKRDAARTVDRVCYLLKQTFCSCCPPY